jgi:DNA ligase (NAD+)
MELQKLRAKIIHANKVYRAGQPIMSDYEFDALMDELAEQDPHDDLLLKVGHINEKDTRKEKLPIEMASMTKVKTVEELKKWMELKEISSYSTLILTPKYDGASLCVKEATKQAWTRGNGLIGQKSDVHLKALDKAKSPHSGLITVGEAILPTAKWEKWSDTYANPRNMVSGQLNSDVPGSELEDCVFMRYGTNFDHMDKIEQLKICNELNSIKVPYVETAINKISEDFLKNLFEKWKKDFALDGVIVEVNDSELRNKLGRERSGNPAYARAYKGNFEEIKETEVLDVEWNVSKQGYLKPVGHVRKVNLDSANVTNVTLFNARFVRDMGIEKGASILIKRSGQVIPFVVSVIHKVKPCFPPVCPSCQTIVEWNDNDVELVCVNDNCESKRLNKIISFFDIMGVENVGEGIFTQLYNSGYGTVEKILKMEEEDFRKLDGFGVRKAEIVYFNIYEKMHHVSLSRIQHASGCFKLLGSKKLVLLEDLYDKNPTVTDILKVEGFAEKSAKDYLQGLMKFKEFIKGLPISIKKEEKVKVISNKFAGMTIVFTGFRRKDWEQKIVENGGVVGSGVTKKTTHLVMKVKGSGSGKEQKALDLGITIMDADEFAGSFI